MDLTQEIADLKVRVAALEARIPKSLVMGDGKGVDDLFGRKTHNTPASAPDDPNFIVAFGEVFGDGGRLITKAEQHTWERRRKAWGGKTDLPDSEAVSALLDYYTLRGVELLPEAIIYSGEPALVFQAPGLGYGTPGCFVLSVATIENFYGEAKRLDGLTAMIDRNRDKEK